MNTILWIHGFPFSSRIFDRQRSIDAAHVIPDLPGFGGSRPPEGPMRMDSYARRLLDAIPAHKFIVAGLSMGGYIAFALAQLAPERIEGLILLDTRATADTEEQRKARYDLIAKVRESGVQPVIDAMLPKMLTPGAPSSLVAEIRAIMEESSPEGVIAALDAMAKRSASTDLLPTLDMPALIIVGEEDPITPPSDAERMAEALPNARLVRIAGAAHVACVEKSEEVNAAIAEWLSVLGSQFSEDSRESP